MDAQVESRYRDPNRLYKVTTIINGQPQEQVVTLEQLARLSHDNIDGVIQEPMRKVFVNPGSDGKNRPRQTRTISGLGVYVWDLLVDAVLAAGEIVPLKSTPFMNTRVRRLRRAFGDSKDFERWFKTIAMPYGIAANIERSWRYIEALAQ